MNVLSSDTLQAVSSHPVHLIDKAGKALPSAFIPFCEFGGNMSTLSKNNAAFKLPVCNSFKDKILNDQMCYEVDLNQYNSGHDIAINCNQV